MVLLVVGLLLLLLVLETDGLSLMLIIVASLLSGCQIGEHHRQSRRGRYRLSGSIIFYGKLLFVAHIRTIV